MTYTVTITFENGKTFTAEVDARDPDIAEVVAEGLATDAGYGRCAAGVASSDVHPAP